MGSLTLYKPSIYELVSVVVSYNDFTFYRGRIMGEQETKFEGLNEILNEKFIQVSKLKRDTWNFVLEQHSLEDTVVRLKEFQTFTGETFEYWRVMWEHADAHPEDATKVDALLEKFKLIDKDEDSIRDVLNQDRLEKEQEKKDKKVDLIKNVTFLLGVPGVFVTGVKNGVGNGHIDQNEALLIGFAISIPTIFHKSIRSAFSKGAKALCSVPSVIKAIPAAVSNDMRIVYVREMIKDAKNQAHTCFSSAAKSINDNCSSRPKSALRRMLGRRDPKP